MRQFKEDEYYIKKLYGAYQLDWMMSHGYSLQDLMNSMTNIPWLHDEHIYSYESDPDERVGMRADIGDIFKSWEFDDIAFDGSCWVCYDEFCKNKLRDMSYIPQLIKYMGGIDQVEFQNWYSQYMTKGEH